MCKLLKSVQSEMNAISLQRRRDVKERKQKMTGSADCCKGEKCERRKYSFSNKLGEELHTWGRF